MKNKKGVSGIVITIILVALVLVAIGIFWGPVQSLIGGQTEAIGYSDKCLKIDLIPTSANCTTTTCTVKVKRGAGGESFDGIKAIFYYADGTSEVEDSTGNVEELATVSKTFTLDSSGAEKVEISAYFTDDAGDKKVCAQKPFASIS